MLQRLRQLFTRPNGDASEDGDAPSAAGEPTPIGPGARVRIRRDAQHPLAGLTGEVIHISGRRVVLRMDEPYRASGVTERVFYSYPEELEVARRVGRLGDVDLYDETEA
jgi:hypothetical protein